jgi:HD-GYP domain-containing protein (c-di-GMP phosphodiesterase class II)
VSEAIRRLHAGADSQFDGDVVNLFVQIAVSESSEVNSSVFIR